MKTKSTCMTITMAMPVIAALCLCSCSFHTAKTEVKKYDLEHHFAPSNFNDFLATRTTAPMIDSNGVKYERADIESGFPLDVPILGTPYTARQLLTNLGEERIKMMDQAGIDVAFLSHATGLYNLPKEENARDYEAVPELPIGQQVQVDFGEIKLRDSGGGKTKVWCAAFLLSHSRYLYVEIQARPYTSVDLVVACGHCFSYFGGMPREMVFDQDSIVCVSENAGDIIYTYEFEKFRQEHHMKIYLCRGADPESKGKIENTIKYVKGNFLANRLYVDDETINAACLKWLERTANARVHGTTKKIPAEVFLLEKDALRPFQQTILPAEMEDERIVRPDNTVVYASNRYSVPYGTYKKYKTVKIDDGKDMLIIKTPDGEVLCEHRISESRGLLIQNTNHKRNKETSINAFQMKLDLILEYKSTDFLKNVRLQKARYARDQFGIVEDLIDLYGVRTVIEGTDFCSKNRLYSANFLRDYLQSHVCAEQSAQPDIDISKVHVQDPIYHVQTEKRPLEVYSKVGV